MKKFLFTLAALLMAGTAFAANVYIPDTEFTEDQIGTQVWLPVYVQLDNEYINGWDIEITYPEGLEVTSAIRKNNAVLTQTAVTDEFGSEESVAFTVNGNSAHSVGACIQGGYWDPDGDGEYELYGAVKIGPTGDFMIYEIRVKPTEAFTGGNIEMTWMVSGGFDNRNGQTKVSVQGTTSVELKAPATAPEVTEAPVITYNEETFTVTATGNGEVKLYVNGEEVENPYTFEQTEEEVTYTVTATAQEAGKEISETATATIVVPAKEVVPEVTEKPVITTEEVENGVKVIATGNGHICLYVEDILVAEGEGVAEYIIESTELEEEYGVSATAQEDGKEVSEYALATVYVPGLPVVPEVTEAPVINVEITDDAYIITATGEGEVVLYVNDVPVENPYTIARGEEDQTIYVYATAQEEGKEMGTTDVQPIVVEAKAGETPVDPHMTGYWIVTIDQYGNEVWKELLPDNGDYTGIVRFEYADYGTFPYDPNKTEEENNAMRPNVEYYVYVDGVRYGAAEDGTLTVLGEALNNPLFEGENNYVLANASGRVYNMGVAIDNATNSMYVYAAVAYYTDVNEMNADKAVAGVRYFNMAGQEMQEANGMTIVVTTYTDGTTSAVKVMK